MEQMKKKYSIGIFEVMITLINPPYEGTAAQPLDLKHVEDLKRSVHEEGSAITPVTGAFIFSGTPIEKCTH